MIDQEEIIRIVAKEYDLLLDKKDPVLSFLAVHDTLLKERMSEFVSDLQDSMRRITDEYQERAKELAEKIVGDAVRKIAAERQEIQNGMLLLQKQEQTENRELMKKMKLVAGIVFAASFISSVALMTAFFIMT